LESGKQGIGNIDHSIYSFTPFLFPPIGSLMVDGLVMQGMAITGSEDQEVQPRISLPISLTHHNNSLKLQVHARTFFPKN